MGGAAAAVAQPAMDLVLTVANDYFLDNLWAALLPAAAFAPAPLAFAAANASSHIPILPSNPKSWSHLISYIPHPPLPADFAASALSAAPAVSAWPRDYIPRQVLSIAAITYLGIHVMYFLIAGLSYKFLFNHEMMKHPRFLKNQVRQEIALSLRSFPGMILLTLPWFQAEVMGHSFLYDDAAEYGWAYFAFSILW